MRKLEHRNKKLSFRDVIDTAYLSLILGVVVMGVYSYFTL